MNPWQNIWSPNVHFPLSGDIAQKIDPSINWFFDGIAAGAGKAKVEKKAFELASYGKQLGMITELLLDLIDHQKISPAHQQALKSLREIQAGIEAIKAKEAETAAQDIQERLLWLRKNDAQGYQRAAELFASLQTEDQQSAQKGPAGAA